VAHLNQVEGVAAQFGQQLALIKPVGGHIGDGAVPQIFQCAAPGKQRKQHQRDRRAQKEGDEEAVRLRPSPRQAITPSIASGETNTEP
jgi:hypothetical protein